MVETPACAVSTADRLKVVRVRAEKMSLLDLFEIARKNLNEPKGWEAMERIILRIEEESPEEALECLDLVDMECAGFITWFTNRNWREDINEDLRKENGWFVNQHKI